MKIFLMLTEQKSKMLYVKNFNGFGFHPNQQYKNLILATAILGETYHKLPHEVLASKIEDLILDLEALQSYREFQNQTSKIGEGSLSEQIKVKRKMLGLVV